ncbi:MAG: preprotein translocase subunit SecY [Lachnospirales bacterium]
MFSVFRNAWKVKDIRSKLIFVLLVLAVYRLGMQILLPGMDYALFEAAKTQAAGGQTLYAMIAGGGTGSIFALGIGPYITASIIMQLLTVAIPSLEQLQKEGAEGRKKINQISRILAVFFAVIQGAGAVFSLRYYFVYQNMLVYVMATLAMVTGTIFVMWMAELINEKGIGNGSSFIIFSNILSQLPSGVTTLYNMIQEDFVTGTLTAIALLAIFLVIIVFVVLVQGGERRIPIQYSKTGRGGANTSYIPMKVNIAGVMAIIFAVSLMQFPAMLNQFFQNDMIATVADFLSLSSFSGAIIYVILIFVFTFFYTSFAINPTEMAENLKRSASYIPGIRPGKPTSDYFERTVYRLSWIGASCYALIALAPILLEFIFKINVGFGGTTLLITTSVCLELTKQLESQLVMRHYKGFLN